MFLLILTGIGGVAEAVLSFTFQYVSINTQK